MNVLQQIKNRFANVLAEMVDEPTQYLAMIRPAQDDKFGDYQANCAMPMANQLGKPSRDVAVAIVEGVDVKDLCQSVEVAGPGFINLTLSDQWLSDQLLVCLTDERLGVQPVADPLTVVIDYSSPNVAKPMHVGHIRSTVIGDSLARVLRFLGHTVITDNHLGDWGTQFGMIIYGYKHFLDAEAYDSEPVVELGRLYRLVRKLVDYHDARRALPPAMELVDQQQLQLDGLRSSQSADDKAVTTKKDKKAIKSLTAKLRDQQENVANLNKKISVVEENPDTKQLAEAHPQISAAVLDETAKLHDGDQTNVDLWTEFMPHCRADMQRIYQRLKTQFDYELGESFYQDQLAAVVADLESTGLARESEGAICVFLDDHDAPMIVRKKDGAFLYATSDLATIKYRVEHWKPDKLLYVVDFRQHEHFAKLFNVACRWRYSDIDCQHISFGTVMGEDGKPFQTRAGDTVGLESLLDESERRALQVVSEVDDMKPEPEFDENQRREIAKVVGIGALKYADLSQNRSSDYTFSYDKMLSLQGNTATYLQYGYARVNGIFRRGEIDPQTLRNNPVPLKFDEQVERALGVKLLRFEETLYEVVVDFRPNLLASFLFDLTQTFFVFFDKCPVLKAEKDLKRSRLQLCDLTARTLKQGLSLLGIDVIPKM